ncbi:MAG: 50S ribosomal protein L22 [Bacilli bacterium]|jgi:large subunit ribosomal protein L22|nr:50S ribosomal protein L22 [Bacilli bacterium]
MEAKAEARELRISADKVRLVIDLVRRKDVIEAIGILNNMNKKGARLVLKTLQSAIANAENNLKLDRNNLYIKECYVNEGQILKRIKPESRGHYGRRDRRYSHITVVVSEKQA